ncbi:MAG: GNAT family N-acetyltransferase [Alistipes sp.]
MSVKIIRVHAVTESLVEAFARLMPQLSSHGCAPKVEELRDVVAAENSVLFAAECDGAIVGVLTLVWYAVPSGRKAWIEDVVVDASQRGSGIGEQLVRAALAAATNAGVASVTLTSKATREAAHRLYRRMGFAEVETSVFRFIITK